MLIKSITIITRFTSDAYFAIKIKIEEMHEKKSSKLDLTYESGQ